MRTFVRFNAENSTFNPQPKPEKGEKVNKQYKYKKKPTGELEVFKKIWDERGPYSQVSGQYLGEFNICHFAHIIPKAKNKYPHFKLNPENICLMTFDEHFLYDNQNHKCNTDEWIWVHDIKDKLKEQYLQLHP